MSTTTTLTDESPAVVAESAPRQLVLYAAALYDPDDVVEVRRIHREKGDDAPQPRSTWHAAHALDGAAPRLAADNADGWNVYAGANPRTEHGRRGDKAVRLARCAFVDFDGCTVADAVGRLESAKLPRPTLILTSGHGVHCYWRLEHATEDLSAWAELQKDLAARLGSDKKVHNPERVMRLPGFLNLKGASPPFPAAGIVECNATSRHAWATLRALVPTRPADVTKPAAPPPPINGNPRRVGDGTRIGNVERAVRYIEKTPDAIPGSGGHDKTLRWAAECYRFGLSDPEALAVLQHFNPHKTGGEPWTERELLHKLADARKLVEANGEFGQHLRDDLVRAATRPNGRRSRGRQRGDPSRGAAPPVETTPVPDDGDGDTAKGIDPSRVIDRAEPLRFAARYLDHRARDCDGQGPPRLRRWRREWHRNAAVGVGYQRTDDEAVRVDVYRHLDTLYTGALDPTTGEPIPDTLARVVANAALVREVLSALPACPDVHVEGEMPRWLDGRTDPDPLEVVAFRNGLLDAGAYCRGEVRLVPPTPLWFGGVACPFDFNPVAPGQSFACPAWLKALAEIFQGDAESIDLLQEWFGLNLVPDNRYERLMMLVGPPRAGKGTVIEALTAMLGPDQVAATSFTKLAGRFGLHPLLGRLAAIMPDAHIANHTDAKAALEVLKSISGNDPQAVDRKGIDELPRVHLFARFTIAVNELPKLPDEAGALKPRLLLLHFARSFAGAEDTGLKPRIRAEAAGIAQWAMEGLKRLRAAGRFTTPAKSAAMVEQFEKIVSPVLSFIDECCQLPDPSDPAEMWVAKDRLFEAWKAWSDDRGSDPGTKADFGQSLINAGKGIRASRRGPRGQQFYCYEGVSLRP